MKQVEKTHCMVKFPSTLHVLICFSLFLSISTVTNRLSLPFPDYRVSLPSVPSLLHFFLLIFLSIFFHPYLFLTLLFPFVTMKSFYSQNLSSRNPRYFWLHRLVTITTWLTDKPQRLKNIYFYFMFDWLDFPWKRNILNNSLVFKVLLI